MPVNVSSLQVPLSQQQPTGVFLAYTPYFPGSLKLPDTSIGHGLEIGFERQPQRQERGTDIEALARALTEQTHDLYLKVPKFDGKSDADAFIDWLDKVEKIFTYKCYGDPKQDGMLKYKGTYEIIAPEDIGLLRSNDYGIVLGKLSGRHALKSRLLEQLGYELDEKELDDVFWRFKEVAEKKKALEMLENSEIEAGVVTEDSKKFDGYGLDMKHLKETTEREIHSAIDLVGGKDEDMSKSFRSKSDDEVATLMREDCKALECVSWLLRAIVLQHLSDGDIEALISDEIFQPQVVGLLVMSRLIYYPLVNVFVKTYE
ncbi:hypothetical protein GIB67_033480 [Kingdonia uniflora]|uniref:2-isopropylmalate synthase/homocitrate synthase post-catalytic domain-containing protein n=1 Tax=Kingdonia uniflora TaxID=39325 RepID=A0A7J7LJX8_9MAGN|nr:hypothetical protein GIB67_033480 [Kingdonia uniflora]